MVPLGIAELLPQMLRDERARAVLRTISTINWKRWGRIATIVGIGYAAVTIVGSGMAILRTAGILH